MVPGEIHCLLEYNFHLLCGYRLFAINVCQFWKETNLPQMKKSPPTVSDTIFEFRNDGTNPFKNNL